MGFEIDWGALWQQGTIPEWISAIGTAGATLGALVVGLAAWRGTRKEKKERLAAERKAELQAIRENARVYCWAGAYRPAFERGGIAYIRNDTDFPLLNLNLMVYTKPVAGRPPFSYNGGVFVPPRQTVEVELKAEHFDPEVVNPNFAFVTFTDVDEYIWTRHPNGALTPYPWPDGLLEPVDLPQGRAAPVE